MWEGGLNGIILAFRRIVLSFTESRIYDSSIMICVLMNTVVLALDGLVGVKGETVLTSFNLAFTYIFTADMGLKIIGMGPSNYVRDKMNIFDGTIVSLSLIELALGSGGSAISAFRSVRIFRVFRVFRVTRMIRTLKIMQIIIKVVSQSLSSFLYIAVLMFLFLYIYALLGY
jgi:hypothetical protein